GRPYTAAAGGGVKPIAARLYPCAAAVDTMRVDKFVYTGGRQMQRRTTTVRVRPATRERLARLGARRGMSTADLLDALAKRAEEDDLVRSLNEDFARLREDPEAWEEYLLETEVWDRTSSDGID